MSILFSQALKVTPVTPYTDKTKYEDRFSTVAQQSFRDPRLVPTNQPLTLRGSRSLNAEQLDEYRKKWTHGEPHRFNRNFN